MIDYKGILSKAVEVVGEEFDVNKALKEDFVDLDAPDKEVPILLSYGQDWTGAPLCIFGEGDYSVITGVGNSKKSFLKTALISSYIGGQTNFGHFQSHRTEDKIVLDIDTEMSERQAKNSFRRVERLVGHRYKNYYPYKLRRRSYTEMLAEIETLIERHGSKLGLVSIDGYADLVSDTNDNVESALLAKKIMGWTDKYQIHITGILHENPNGGKMRGHLGSEMSRKASTILKVEASATVDNESRVFHSKSRDEKFKKFDIYIQDALPRWKNVIAHD